MTCSTKKKGSTYDKVYESPTRGIIFVESTLLPHLKSYSFGATDSKAQCVAADQADARPEGNHRKRILNNEST